MTHPTILLTGASGFLGRMLFSTLQEGGPIRTLGRSGGQDIRLDLAREVPALSGRIERVVHNAGKAHVVPRTDAEAALFFAVNYQGTLNLLKGLSQLSQPPEQFVFISTVAVYGREEGLDISEDHPLQGNSPYAKSKIQAEKSIQAWCNTNDVKCLILRLPLVVGPNPPGNLGQMAKAIRRGRYPRIKGNCARKSAVLGRDVANLVANLHGKEIGIYNLTDGEHPGFADLEESVAAAEEKKLRIAIPQNFIKIGAVLGDSLHQLGISLPINSSRYQKITSSLTFDDTKARRELGWNSRSVIQAIISGELKK